MEESPACVEGRSSHAAHYYDSPSYEGPPPLKKAKTGEANMFEEHENNMTGTEPLKGASVCGAPDSCQPLSKKTI
jgi:hypothetical protein